jgi:RNA polymerase sigma-70 factor (ECF subfamily)
VEEQDLERMNDPLTDHPDRSEESSDAGESHRSPESRYAPRIPESGGLRESGQRETEIFQKFLGGSDEAFRTLYDLYERPLYLYLLRILTSDADAQDVFQEVWVRMYRLRGEQGKVTKFSGLLFTIARNLALNAIRDRKRLPDVSIENVALEAQPAMQFSDEQDLELREMMQKALAQLPEHQREAFVLREYNGYSYQEIAEITGSTMVNVKTRAWRARERLRKVIAAWLELRAES